MKAILKVLIVWMTLLVVPLQGFASASMSLCAQPPAAAQHDDDHELMAEDSDMSNTIVHNEHAAPVVQDDHHPASHHHSGKCAACASCCACAAMAPSFVAALPVAASPSIIVPFDQHILPSVDPALLERPPRA